MIIAVDFDGVLCEDRFPDIGPPIERNINLVKWLVAEGHEVVLWTSRVEQPLLRAAKWCVEQGIKFCAINENAPSNREKYRNLYTEKPRKIYADVYIDDHAAGYNRVNIMRDVIDKMEEIRRIRNENREQR